MAKKTGQAPSAADWLDSEQETEPQHVAVPDSWRSMDEIGELRSGELRVLTPGGRLGHVCAWRQSRAFDTVNGRWVETGFWTLHNSGGQQIGWEPVGWLPYQEPAYGKRS